MKRSRGRYLGNQTVLTIKHTEFVRDITPTDGFNLQVEEAVNPGLLTVFPWLGLIGQNFEEYKFHKLCFHYRSHSSDAILNTTGPGSTALGSVMMAFQYNVLAPPYINKKDLLNNATAVSTKPSLSKSIYLDLRHQPLRKLWIRTPTVDSSQLADRRLYDIADFHLATQGCQGTAGAIGELWVTAIVTFTKPTTQFRAVPFDAFQWSWTFDPGAEDGVAHTYANLPLNFSTMQPSGPANPALTTQLKPITPESNFGGLILNTQANYGASATAGTVNTYPGETQRSLNEFQEGWAYRFPSLVANYPSAMFETTWTVSPDFGAQVGKSCFLGFLDTGAPMSLFCQEVALNGRRGRTAGNDTLNNSGIVSQHFWKIDDNITPGDPFKLPVINYFNYPQLPQNTGAIGNHLTIGTTAFDFRFTFTVNLLQVEYTV
jgi:hypothetical protein